METTAQDQDNETATALDGRPRQAEAANAEGEDDAGANEQVENRQESSELSDAERIDKLFDEMPTRRRDLVELLTFCQVNRTDKEILDFLNALQTNDHSVFSPANLTMMLSEAGALKSIGEDGSDRKLGAAEPVLINEGGTSYYIAAQPQTTYWQTTREGVRALERNSFDGKISEVLAEDARYSEIYQRILGLCSADEGATAATLSESVDDDPLLQSPRLYVQYFLERLESADAIRWVGAWKTTERGAGALAKMRKGAIETTA